MNVDRTQTCGLTMSRPGARTQSPVVTAADLFKTPEASFADEDGVKHINIDRNAKTELGKTLTHLHRADFTHPYFGPFLSVEGLIGFIRSGGKDAQFHYLHGMDARYRSKKLDTRFIRGFREVVMEANYLKIIQNTELHAKFLASTLPFEHYYMFQPAADRTGHRPDAYPIRPQNASWLIPSFDALRSLMQAGGQPEQADYSGVTEMENAPNL